MPNLVLNRSRYNLKNPMQTAGGKYDSNNELYAWYQFSDNISSFALDKDLIDKSGNYKHLSPMPSHDGTKNGNTLVHTHRPGLPVDDNPGNDVYDYTRSEGIKLFLSGDDILTRVSSAGGFFIRATDNITTEINTIKNRSVRAIKGTGADDHAFINDHENLNFPSTSDFSMSLWLYHDSAEENESELVSKGAGFDLTREWVFTYAAGNYIFFLFDENTDGFISKEISSQNLTDGWHHWFITNGSANDLSDFNVFIDGQPAPAASVSDGVPSGVFETTRNLGGNLYIGKTLKPSFKVADVALWNRIIPNYTIEKIYNSYSQISKKVPQGFSEKSSMFSDTILHYEPDTNRFSFVDNEGDQSFSISAWIKPNDKNVNRNQTIVAKTAISKNDVIENAEWRLFLDDNGNMVFRVTSPNNAGFKQVLIPSATVDDYRASWTNVIATYNPNKPSPEIYINGSIKGTPDKTASNEDNPFNGMTKSAANMTIGALDVPTSFLNGEEIGNTNLEDNNADFDDAELCSSISQSFSGLILEIAFWKTELNATNIQALYSSYKQCYLVRGDSGATQIGFNISGEVFDEQRQGINIRDINDQTTSLFTKIRPISDDIKTFRFKDLSPVIFNDEIATTSYASNTSYQRYDLLNEYLDNNGKKYSNASASS